MSVDTPKRKQPAVLTSSRRSGICALTSAAPQPDSSPAVSSRAVAPSKRSRMMATDLLSAARQNRADAVDIIIASNHAIETAQIDNPDFGRDAAKRIREQAVNEGLARQMSGLDHAMERNAAELRDAFQARETMDHLRALRVEAAATKRRIDAVSDDATRPAPRSNGPGM